MKVYTLFNSKTELSLLGTVVLADDAAGAKRLAVRSTLVNTSEKDWEIGKIFDITEARIIHNYSIR